jgi:hypothetical protein
MWSRLQRSQCKTEYYDFYSYKSSKYLDYNAV